MKLDRIDFEILRILQNNARISNKELAEKNDISPSTCLERVRRLNETGIIKSYRAEVLPEALGIGIQAMVTIRLRQHDDFSFGRLIKEFTQREEVVNAYLLASTNDFLVHVAVRDVAHLRSIVLDAYSARKEISHVETSLIFDFHRSDQLPNFSSYESPTDGSSNGEYI
jgi:DNA-binding Lrp family transcriptional regulator